MLAKIAWATQTSLSSPLKLNEWLPSSADGIFSQLTDLEPWKITSAAESIIRKALGSLSGYTVHDGVAVHRLANVEKGATLKAPAIIGPNCFVAAGAYLRGGIFMDEASSVGPNCEVKSSFLLAGSKIAHLSFVGDSIIGANVNIEAGVKIANYRNEHKDKRIRILFDGETIDTGVDKFGALIGEGVKVGANAVIAPGALIRPGEIIPRLSLIDQSPK